MKRFYIISLFFLMSLGSVAAQQKQQEPKVKLYPNPATSFFAVHATGDKVVKVEIYSLVGVKEKVVKNDFTNIDIRGLLKGIYMVKVYTRKSYVVKKLVKRQSS